MSCVTREIVLPVPRERAWELVTEPADLLKRVLDLAGLPSDAARANLAGADPR